MRDEHPSAVGELARAWQTWPGPSIIMAGDSNTTRDAVMSAMTRLHCPRIQAPLMALMTPFDFSVKLEKIEPVQADREMLALLAIADRGAGQLYERLPHIRGVDNKHEVGCYDICVATPPAFPLPEGFVGFVPRPRHAERQGSPCLDAGPEEQEEADSQEAQSSEGHATQDEGPPHGRCRPTKR